VSDRERRRAAEASREQIDNSLRPFGPQVSKIYVARNQYNVHMKRAAYVANGKTLKDVYI